MANWTRGFLKYKDEDGLEKQVVAYLSDDGTVQHLPGGMIFDVLGRPWEFTEVENGVGANVIVLNDVAVMPYGAPEDTIAGNASNADGNITPLIAAGGVGVRHYLNWTRVTNTHASQFTYVEIKDGATVRDTIGIPPGFSIFAAYGKPLRGSENTAWNFDPAAATANIIVSAGGYAGPA